MGVVWSGDTPAHVPDFIVYNQVSVIIAIAVIGTIAVTKNYASGQAEGRQQR